MSTELAPQNIEKVDALVEEIKATFTERTVNAREEVILAHWETGKLIHEHLKHNKGVKITALVQLLADRGAGRERTLWDSAKFYEAFPRYKDIDKLGHGKNVSWNKIKAALIPAEENPNARKEVKLSVAKDEWDGIRVHEVENGTILRFKGVDTDIQVTIVA